MLKKLYKHEFYSLFRNLLPIYAALIGFAVLSRLTLLIKLDENKNSILSVITGLSVTVYIFAIFAVFIVGLVIVVMRFYKNLLSHEGYLTFTLPFTPTQHIVCKLLCGVVVTVINFVMVVCSLFILGAGTEVMGEILSDIKIGWNAFYTYAGTGKTAIIVGETAVLCIMSAFQSLLMFYASIAIGQQFKNRIGGAVISYICIYAAVQIITSLLMIPASYILVGNIEQFNDFINNSMTALSVFLGALIVYSAVLSAAYFFITRHFLTKKLNLE